MDKLKRSKDIEDGSFIDKTQVLQEARQCFMGTSIKTKKLIDTLTKCIFVLLQGEKLAQTEATDLFFHITRLFQYKDKDGTLRKLIYIGIKALSKQADNVYVVTASLTTDVNSSRDDPTIRASALRALCQISDASTFTTIERYLKQSIVDKHPVVASAAISSLIRIATVNSEVVRRCTNEIQEALNSDSPMVQYHALGLRYNSCKNDRLSTSRLISNCISQGLRSPLAECLLIRIIANYINEHESEENRSYLKYITNHLNHRSDMVEYEAANALVNLLISRENEKRRSAVAHLRNFISSSKPALRYAAVRSLSRLADSAPSEVRECNLDLENLISQVDCNRSIAILAITTLLKTGTESSVEKFLKQIREFLSEIDDSFKVVVVKSVRKLCQKYPSKHPVMMDFLSKMLREEGGFLYKESIVETIIKMIEDNEETKEKGLEHLCEFIEDCEHEALSIEVLNLLGREGPKTKKASTYIRFIANRLLLDTSAVACAATSALAKFAVIPELSENIKTALDRFSLHEDFEVMERTVLYRNILAADNEQIYSKFIIEPAPKISYADLEAKLAKYLEGDCEVPFNMDNIKTIEQYDVVLNPLDNAGHDEEMDYESTTKAEEKSSGKGSSPTSGPPSDIFDDVELGELITSTKPRALTDSVSEFAVQCTKYTYNDHLVLQFDCTNTVNHMYLENVTIEMCAPEGLSLVAGTECPKLAFEETASIYILIEITEDKPGLTYFTEVVMKYNFKNVDPETGEVDHDDVNEDVYPLEDVFII